MHNPADLRALSLSPFLERLDRRHPDWLEQLHREGRLEAAHGPQPEPLDRFVAERGLDAGLRRFRNQEMMRIVWRELNRTASLEDTLDDLSRLAEICIDRAAVHHDRRLRERHGAPRDSEGAPVGLTVLALGKLGGGELNLSSDIDIVFCFRAPGETTGPRQLANEQYFQRLARAIIQSLGEVTEAGFCFRVDTRLRPFGEAGPLVCSFGAMEQYYQREGRDWERYALVKARPVAGDIDAGHALLRELRPFVYRRYIDFGAVEALREMRSSVRRDARRKGREEDLKRGEGGIRDVEFLVQCLQLLRGGREPALQTPRLLEALQALVDLDVLPAALAQTLRDDYATLRRAENAVQALHDQQVHALPADREDLARVARIMGHPSADEMRESLAGVRVRVNSALDALFPAAEDPACGVTGWNRAGDSLDTDSALAGFRRRVDRMALSQRAMQRLERFMPMLMERLQAGQVPESAQKDVFELVSGICRRSAYLALLVENPVALDRALTLFTQSDWIAKTVIRHPALLDELIDPALGQVLPTRDELAAAAQRVLTQHEDTDARLQALNYLKRSAGLRIAVAELSGNHTSADARARLTELAECLLKALLSIASASLAARHGRLPGSAFTVVAYGTLGAAEMSYGSDLDLIFLYRRGDGDSDGDRPLAPETYFTRLARRILSLATTLTPAGRLYEIDTRLRPNGRAGMLVSSLDAFERYQMSEAWVWELQALVRGRAVAGDPLAAERFESVRHAVLEQQRDAADTREAVLDMRQRMRDEFGGREVLKHGPGGLVDIGFVAQLGVLCCAHGHPNLLAPRSTSGMLAALAENGCLDESTAGLLMATEAALTRARHRLALQRDEPGAPPDTTRCAEACAQVLATGYPAHGACGGLE